MVRYAKRQDLIVAYSEGQYHIEPAPFKGIAFSGGGAKGQIYAGMLEALERSGEIGGVEAVSGASAGAMTASLVAFGYKASEIRKIIDVLNPDKLWDSALSKYFRIASKGSRFEHIFELFYLLKLKQFFNRLDRLHVAPEDIQAYERLRLKLTHYDDVLMANDININSIDDLTTFMRREDFTQKLDEIFDEERNPSIHMRHVYSNAYGFDYSDLEYMHSKFPHHFKHLNVVIANQSTGKLDTYNKNTPDSKIARTVQISGAYPLLFQRRINDEGEVLTDGGVYDNLPVNVLKDSDDLKEEQILSVGLSTSEELSSRIDKIENPTPLSYFFSSYFFRNTDNTEKKAYQMGNFLLLNTHDVTTTSFSIDAQTKNKLFETGLKDTYQFLKERRPAFDHPLLAYLYMDLARLAKGGAREHEPIIKKAIDIDRCQKNIIEALNAPYIANIEQTLQVNFEKIEQNIRETEPPALTPQSFDKAMVLVTKQIDNATSGALNRLADSKIELPFFSKIAAFLAHPIDYCFSQTYRDSLVEERALESADVRFFKDVKQKMNESLKHDTFSLDDQDPRPNLS